MAYNTWDKHTPTWKKDKTTQPKPTGAGNSSKKNWRKTEAPLQMQANKQTTWISYIHIKLQEALSFLLNTLSYKQHVTQKTIHFRANLLLVIIIIVVITILKDKN